MINTGRLGRWLAGLSGRPRPDGTTDVALGTFCHVAAALRDCGLRRWTGPFDWIFSTPAMIASCLSDDFETFLDPRQFRSVPAAELTAGARRQCRHLGYEERFGLPPLFNHHDPAANEGDRRQLERAVGRFRRVMAGDGPASFYMLSERRWPEDEIAELGRALAARPGATRLVVVTAEPGAEMPGWSRERETPHGRADVLLRTGSRSLGATYPDARDNILLADALRAVATGRR